MSSDDVKTSQQETANANANANANADANADVHTDGDYHPQRYTLPPLPVLPITSRTTLEKCRNLPVGSNDIFIASFPKSGTTWMQNIVIQLILETTCHNKNKNKNTMTNQPPDELLPLQHISDYAPFYDIDPHWEDSSTNLIPKFQQHHKALGYRVFNTHLRWDMLPHGNEDDDDDDDNVKFIYVVRDGRDVVTSFYHHLSNQEIDDGGFQGNFDEFFEQFIQGMIPYGKWSHHLASWMPEIEDKNNKNILLVQYEHLKADLRSQVQRVGQFLGILTCKENPLQQQQSSSSSLTTEQDKEILDRVLNKVSFDYMRQHQELFHPISVRWKPGYNFIRSGTVGDYKSLFTELQRQRFMETVHADFRELLVQEQNKSKEKAIDDTTNALTNTIPSWLYKVGFVV